MRKFLKSILASCLGVILALGIIVLIGIGVISRIADKASQPPKIAANTILHLKFDEPIPERTNNVEMNPFDFEDQRTLGLQDIIRTIEYASEVDQIQGMFLELQGVAMGQSTMHALHDALSAFSESGKKIVAYGDYFSQGTYYLSSVSDQIYVNPVGDFNFKGFSAIIPFFKTMLDKIGVNMQVFYAGQFKSATEPYRLNEMSDANKLQVRTFLEELFEMYLADISVERDIPISELRSISDDFKIRQVNDALHYGLVDQLGYRDDAVNWLKNQVGLEADEKLPLVDLEDYYLTAKENTDFSERDKIAILYAEGNIIMGQGEAGTIGDEDYVRMIKKIREDDNVKAVVLRVNSPGGSALASENIWRELQLTKDNHKPLIVSMGDYAASGGYYIACLADSIVASPSTLTGSIGVFNVIPNASTLLNDKMGISFDSVKTGSNSTGLTPFFDLSPEEKVWMQTSVDSMYEHFLMRVSQGRDLSRDAVHEVAQGRVWTGQKAVEIGLVDQLGDLDDAIDMAAYLAGLETYRLSEYPEIKEPFQQFMEELTGQESSMQTRMIKENLGDYYPYFQNLSELKHLKGPQARLPFLVLPQ
ncbi:MAG: signal peptide peptidase SppA [Bacteroidetes bacterium]|nr:signal peptide peptidase SppA [Bacteroidota bacterium]